MNDSRTGKIVLLILLVVISGLFLVMIKPFIRAVVLAGILASLAQPLYRRLLRVFHQRTAMASLATLLVIVLLIIVPLAALLGVVTAEAIKVGSAVSPWIQQQISHPDQLATWLQTQPYYDRVAPYQNEIMTRLGAMVSAFSGFLINSLSAATTGTAQFVFMLMIMLYSMYFFLSEGGKLVDLVLYYLPLADHEERRLLDKFSSVARATLKGTAVIGALQGGLAGLAFAIVGIPSAIFWATIMTVLSIVPGIGTALVWVPAAGLLIAAGHTATGVGLALFCGLIVGSIDNFLRPRIVGQDTEMPDLLILLSTLGGILMFGALGLIIGPIIAALFVTIWDIYGTVFQEVLPPGRQS